MNTMNRPLHRLGFRLSSYLRARRAARFRALFPLTAQTRILDLGGGTGAHIHSVLAGTSVQPQNVYVADIGPRLELARTRYGYQPIQITEDGRLPFPDQYFDVVWCSSVLEHVTVPKAALWSTPGKTFRREAIAHQSAFASEIRRIGRSFWVQSPAQEFPIETHLWLPFVHWLPRTLLLRITKIAQRVWISGHMPDYHLLRRAQMEALFPGAMILVERFCGLPKSWIACLR